MKIDRRKTVTVNNLLELNAVADILADANAKINIIDGLILVTIDGKGMLHISHNMGESDAIALLAKASYTLLSETLEGEL